MATTLKRIASVSFSCINKFHYFSFVLRLFPSPVLTNFIIFPSQYQYFASLVQLVNYENEIDALAIKVELPVRKKMPGIYVIFIQQSISFVLAALIYAVAFH
jgi:hypothetical protein